jgi:hypothetical protein
VDGSQALGSPEDLRLLIEIGFGFVSILLAAIGGLMGIILYKLFDGIGELRETFVQHVADDDYQTERTTRLYQHLHIEEIPRRQR